MGTVKSGTGWVGWGCISRDGDGDKILKAVGMGMITTGAVGDGDKSCPRAALYLEKQDNASKERLEVEHIVDAGCAKNVDGETWTRLRYCLEDRDQVSGKRWNWNAVMWWNISSMPAV